MALPDIQRKAQRRKGGRGQDGMAILIVLACLAVMIPFIAQFNYDAKVDWQSAVNNADEVKARHLNRGAMNLSVLMFELQRQVFNQKQFRDFMGAMDITMVAPYLMSAFGTQDGAEGLAGLGSMAGLDINPEALEGLAVTEGNFEVRLEAEDGRINVNCIAQQSSGKNIPRSRTVEAIETLMIPVIYDPLFDEEKSDGQRYTRQQVLTAIVDYIDDDRKRFDLARLGSSGVPERYRYTELHDPYQARNARLDTIDELMLVEGVDDDWLAAFGGELTVYKGDPECKVNLNFASAEQIALVLRHAVSNRDKEKTEGENYITKTLPLANFVVESRQWNLFEKLEDVRDLVAQPDQFLNPALLLGDDSGSDSLSALPRVPDGLEVRVESGRRDDTGDEWGGLADVSTVAPARVYRVEIITNVGGAQKRVDAVFDMQYARTQSAGKGAWLYYREQ